MLRLNPLCICHWPPYGADPWANQGDCKITEANLRNFVGGVKESRKTKSPGWGVSQLKVPVTSFSNL